MTAAALAGLGSGALHAVSGPDHVLSLAPLSLGVGRGAWRVGLLWGLGHALGTVLCVAAVAGVAAALQLDVLALWGERLAGLALVVTGAMGLRRGLASRARGMRAGGAGHEAKTAWGVGGIGFIHGLTGAAALLLLLPAAVSDSRLWQALYLGGFAFGSTLAMAGLTAALAAGSRSLPRREALMRRVSLAASAGSVALGGWWMLA